MTMRTIQTISAISIALAVGIGCGSTKPKSTSEQVELESEARDTIAQMEARMPGLRDSLQNARGYAVFPEIGKGGLIVGGAHGHGVLFEHGQIVGYVKMNEASIGLQAGGESFGELIVFYDQESLADIKDGNFEMGAKASVVALDEGAGAGMQPIEQGTAVYILPRGGLMADVSVSGQQIEFEPRG
jgi:lipid-binding SYLF domain-containing protein